jgi:predicted cytidylate kinase
MRITLSGDLGSGKSTVGRRLAERLRLPHYSAGSLFREIGQIANLDALQTNLAAEDNVTIDEAVDNRTRELDRSGESFIIDSRMAWHFVTGAARVYLSASPETAARRIAADTTRSSETYTSHSEALASLERRRESEIRRYKKLYSADITDPGNYDLIIITDDADVDDIAELIIRFAEHKTQEKYWIPKRRLVPMIDAGGLTGAGSPPGSVHSASLPIVISRNFGFFFDGARELAVALENELSLVSYQESDETPGGEDAFELARRTLKFVELQRWQYAFKVAFSFADCLARSFADD